MGYSSRKTSQIDVSGMSNKEQKWHINITEIKNSIKCLVLVPAMWSYKGHYFIWQAARGGATNKRVAGSIPDSVMNFSLT
jgi:hypothetical protein